MSTTYVNAANIRHTTMTMAVDSLSSSLVGQVTFRISFTTPVKKSIIFSFIAIKLNLARQEGFEPPTCGFGDRCSAN